MADPLDSGDDIFGKLQKGVDPKIQEEKDKLRNEREHAQYEKARRRLGELIQDNSTLPTTISSIRVIGAPNTRKSFLERIFNPILSVNHDRPYTLAEAIREVSIGADKLNRLDIFHEPISLYLDRPPKTDPSTTPTDIDIYLTVREKSRILLKTGTSAGNGEGEAYTNLLLRNIFGGAESLSVNASLGTRTRSAYSASFESPILSNPSLRLELGGLASSTQKTWSSHEEVLRGAWTKLRYLTPNGSKHELAYNAIWRQITSLSPSASPTVRHDAGDSLKSSLTHTWTLDLRDNPMLPTRGTYTRSLLELAGWGPLVGDVAFAKTEIETQAATPVPIPGLNGISFTTGLRAGLLYPLSLNRESKPRPSRINDRFSLGGPTDVRGFRLSGLGPRDGSDALGGDIYYAFSTNLLFPIPRVPLDTPFRFQAFITGGRLLALDKKGANQNEKVGNAVRELVGNGWPSVAAGVGLVYAHPVARFELNFSLPLVVRRGEWGRKGVSFGVGISML
ncbi:hypothetical protein JMJ35_009072 [Cladonia borealis]|uniref:Bacterial surface antigen (D15) domain-containing protein n=1 Tax=Cladonia borealis TaxID=184061 RepID=A0AA39U6E4_9LECA|nr:hypothetical protein JMJ35_009072 [Cladonia borealis]